MANVTAEQIDAAAAAVLDRFALFGNLYGKAIELSRDMVREIVAVAVEAAASVEGD